MQWNVHVKNELGRDDNIAVEAESEIAAERAAAQHGSVAVVMGAYPADAASPPLVEATATGEFSQIADEFDAVAASARAARTDTDRESVAEQWNAVMGRARDAVGDDGASDDRPSWMGGPANTNPPRRSLEPTWGHSAAYNGNYDSKGGYADGVHRTAEQGRASNTRAEVARAREAIAQLRGQQTSYHDPGRALTADDRLDARGR